MWIRPRNYSTACTPRAIVLCSVGSLTFNPSHFRTRRRVHGNSAPRPWIRHVRAWPPTTHPRHRCGGCRRARAHSRVPEDDGRAWPGFEPTRRAAGSRRGGRAGGRARRHPEHRRRSHCRLVRQVTTSDAATTSVPEGGGRAWPLTTHPRHRCGGCRRDRRAWPPTTHPRHQCGGCRRAKVHSRVPEGGGRAWPGFEIDYSEPKARVWRSRGRAAALRHQDRFTRSRRHREPERPVATCDAATTSSI